MESCEAESTEQTSEEKEVGGQLAERRKEGRVELERWTAPRWDGESSRDCRTYPSWKLISNSFSPFRISTVERSKRAKSELGEGWEEGRKGMGRGLTNELFVVRLCCLQKSFVWSKEEGLA